MPDYSERRGIYLDLNIWGTEVCRDMAEATLAVDGHRGEGGGVQLFKARVPGPVDQRQRKDGGV